MFKSLVKMVAGDPVERALSRYREVVERINALEPAMKKLSNDELRVKTAEFKGRLEGIDDLDIFRTEMIKAKPVSAEYTNLFARYMQRHIKMIVLRLLSRSFDLM